MRNILTRNFLEIRFNPIPSILDIRGHIAEKLIGSTFNSWAIVENAIKFKHKEDKFITGYFSFRNFGIGLTETKPDDYFIDKCRPFINKAWPFLKNDDLVRIGIRTCFYSKMDSFKKTQITLQDKFLKEGGNDLKKLGEKIIDVGFAFDFSDKGNLMNISFGPMKKEQAKGHFSDEKDLYEQGLFLNLDYFNDKCKKIKRTSDAISFIELGLKKSRAINSQLLRWLKEETVNNA